MKKFLAIVLVLACVLGLCACGGNGGSAGSKGDKNVEGRVTLSIGIPTSAMVLSHENNALTTWIEETCNVKLKFVEYAGGTDVATQISTNIAARQELPDILYGISIGDSMITRYGKDGYFLDLSDYYAKKDGLAKTFWDRMENELSEYDQDMILRKITDPETGAIYCVPCVETSLVDKMQSQVWINREWLDRLNLKAPTNKDELLHVLREFKNKDANGNGDPSDEIPLFGSQDAMGSRAIDWLINMFCYYDNGKPYNVGKDGKLYPVYTTDEYRDGLKFVRQLYKEQLLTQMAWTTTGGDMKQIVTPSNGVSRCGIFLGHLTVTTATNSKVLEEYDPLPYWGNVIRSDTSCLKTTFITEDCENPEKAFEVLMTMWTWEGSMRIRYGEYKVNWTDPDAGAKSDLGLDATYKLISDPLNSQSTAKWAKIASTLNVYAEGETAQIDENASGWYALKSEMHAKSYENFLKAEQENNDPSVKCPLLTYTEEEKERTSVYTANVADRRSKAQTEFIVGSLNIESDTDWNNYLKQLNDLGLPIVLEAAQTAYDRGA